MATPPVAVEFTVEGLEHVKQAFREVAAESKQTTESIDRMDVSYKRLAFSVAHVGTAALAMESIFERVSKGQMSIIEGALRLIPTLITLASSIWTVVTAEKARAVASAIAHSISSLGAAVPLIAAAAAAATGIALAATATIPSKEYGGLIERTGIYELHKGELVVPAKTVEKFQRFSEVLKQAETKEIGSVSTRSTERVVSRSGLIETMDHLQRFSEVIRHESLREYIKERFTPITPAAGAYEHLTHRESLTLVFDIHDNRFASDYDADRAGDRIIDKLRRAGVI